jgi:hypothetical protein
MSLIFPPRCCGRNAWHSDGEYCYSSIIVRNFFPSFYQGGRDGKPDGAFIRKGRSLRRASSWMVVPRHDSKERIAGSNPTDRILSHERWSTGLVGLAGRVYICATLWGVASFV